MKKLLKELVAPFIVKLFKKKRTDWGWFGELKTWEEAEKAAIGYDAGHILEKMKQSFRELKRGTNVFELDTILYKEKRYNYPLLFSLSWIALQKKSVLNIIDFGGALGSAYYWVKDFLLPTTKLNWNIIEQPHIVAAGKAEFETSSLHFFENFDACFKLSSPDILLFSSVLQYIPDKGFLYEEIRKRQFSYIIIDRTPYFSNKERPTAISVQKLNDTVYGKETTLPCFIYNKTEIVTELENEYDIVLDNPNFEDLNYDYHGENFYFRFVLLQRKKQP